MTTLDAVSAELGSLADRFDALAARFDARADEVQALHVMIARIEERQIARSDAEAAHRAAMAPLPERIAAVETQCAANARAIDALDGRGWDRWLGAGRGVLDLLVGPGGFLRTAQGVAVVVLLAIVAGALTVDQALALWASVPTLVPVPIPQP